MLDLRQTALGLLGVTLVPGCFDPNTASTCASGACDEGSTSDGDADTDPTSGAPDGDSGQDEETSDSTSSGEGPSSVGDDEGSSSSSESRSSDGDGSSGEGETSGPPAAECGNGVVEAGEACDDGEDNSDTLADACRTTCVLPTCGDTVVDSDEDCDETAPGCLVDCSFDAPDFGEFPEATVVIGQTDFESDASFGLGFAFRFPRDVLTHEGRLYMADGNSAGIYVFDAVPTEPGVLPENVLGRDALGGATTPFGPNSIGAFSRGMTTDGTRFAIGDVGAPRILIYDEAPVVSSNPDVVVGQPDLESTGSGLEANRFGGSPADVLFVDGRLLAADSGGNRVMVWNSIPTEDDAPADLVLGQTDFGAGETNAGGEVSASTLARPHAVWSDGVRLAVADRDNHRVLLWDSFPTTSGQAADRVIGQADMASGGAGGGADGFNNPLDVLFVGGRLYVSDQLNHRVLYFEGWPTTDGQPADGVIGQSDFEANAPNDDNQDGSVDGQASARTLNRPFGLHFDQGQLFVADTFNDRVLIFEGD